MADNSKIEWTDASWTPIRAARMDGELVAINPKVGWHCEHVSEGCRNCYAERMNRRLGTGLDFKPGNKKHIGFFLDERLLTEPLRWKRPRKVFVCSMTDLFADFVPDEHIDRMFAVMALCPQHNFQVLTKRSARMREYCSDPRTPGRIARAILDMLITKVVKFAEPWPVQTIGAIDDPDDVTIQWPLPNVWKGVSVEDQPAADQRIPDLLATPAAIRLLSCEPLLGPIDLTWLDDGLRDGVRLHFDALTGEAHDGEDIITGIFGCPDPKVDWVIVGGESGPNARPMHPAWARSLRDQCADAGVPFFFKQWGEWRPTGSVDIYCHGPEKRHREFPNASGISWLKDGRICLRDFTVAEHNRRITNGEASCSRAVEVDESALSDFHATLELKDGPINPLSYQWMYRVGKKAAGRLLDGADHNGMPESASCDAAAANPTIAPATTSSNPDCSSGGESLS